MIDTIKALSDPQRIKILKLLARREMGACEVINALGLAQPTVSHHLKMLRQAGLVNSEKQGKMVFFTLNGEGLKDFSNQMASFLNELSCEGGLRPEPSPLRQNPGLCSILRNRSTACE
ncbi:MAG TPA: metalloregulator ArsR/SmtB family transcription factor [Bacillota bacterium]|nr:metalloregulator ArsR/SmtB family transcription factor [Bacillota bacterium]